MKISITIGYERELHTPIGFAKLVIRKLTLENGNLLQITYGFVLFELMVQVWIAYPVVIHFGHTANHKSYLILEVIMLQISNRLII